MMREVRFFGTLQRLALDGDVQLVQDVQLASIMVH